VVYADGNEVPYRCSLHPQCKLGSTLVIPLRGENQRVVGTIKLYEAKNRLFSSINRTLGEGLRSCCRRKSSPDSMSGKSVADAVGNQITACAGESPFSV
jgi:two-component system LytT family sensor kinase